MSRQFQRPRLTPQEQARAAAFRRGAGLNVRRVTFTLSNGPGGEKDQNLHIDAPGIGLQDLRTLLMFSLDYVDQQIDRQRGKISVAGGLPAELQKGA